MPGFLLHNRSLHCDGVPLDRIAQSTDTPVHVYSAALITERYRALERAFAECAHRCHYAIKANATLGVVRLMRSLGAHADANLEHVMCRNLISVDWRGFVYDCDFNQMLDLPLLQDAAGDGGARVHLKDLIAADLEDRPIRVAGHCYGCTAGQGSSCGGALRDAAE